MPIPVTDLISTTDPSDTYATHSSVLGKGGLHEVASVAARDAITVERRKEGMLVYCQDTSSYYSLNSDLLSWSVFGGSDVLTLEAGEDLTAGTPVYISANKVYAANNLTQAKVVGLVAVDVLSTFSAVLIAGGNLSLTGLTVGDYYLGNGIIQTSVPSSGSVVKVGTAISSTKLVVNIHLSILLS